MLHFHVTIGIRRAESAKNALLVALLAAALAIGWVLSAQAMRLRSIAQPPRLTIAPDGPGKLLMADGIDQNGQVEDQMPTGTRRMVVFGLSAPGIQSELALWEGVYRHLPRGTFLLGFCADRACAAREAGAKSSFPIIIAGEPNRIVAVRAALYTGRFLVTNNHARILAEPQFSGRSTAQVVAGIEAAK